MRGVRGVPELRLRAVRDHERGNVHLTRLPPACHARYHDPEYDMPLWVDMSRAQRAAFTYPKL